MQTKQMLLFYHELATTSGWATIEERSTVWVTSRLNLQILTTGATTNMRSKVQIDCDNIKIHVGPTIACEDVKTLNTKTKFICFRISEKV